MASARGRGGHEPGGGGRRRLAGHHVGPVHGEGGEQLGQHRVQISEAQPGELRDASVGEQASQAVHLGREAVPDHLPLGGLCHVGEARRPLGEPRVGGGQRAGPGRVEEQAADSAERVVPGRARAMPVPRQFLGPGEDLLGDHPGAAGRLGQPVQVAARIGEPIGVVHPQAVDEPFVHQAEQQAVGRGEDVLVLYSYRDERGDVEESPPVQFGRGGPPAREPVVLGGGQVRQGQAPGARAHRKHVLVVAQHGPVRPISVHPEIAEAVGEWPGQYRQQQPPPARLPVDVEPVRERRPGPVPKHRPELAVQRLGSRNGHVVGHDVGDHAEPMPPEPRHHVTERALAAEVGGYPRMVYHVVAMHGTGGSLQDRREVSMGDAEAGQVSGDAGGVSEPEPGLKLQPVAGLWCGRDGHG